MAGLSLTKKRSNVEFDITSHTYLKSFADEQSFLQEYRAVKACQGDKVQKLLETNQQARWLRFEYNENDFPLLELAQTQSCIFIKQLPNIIKAISHCHSKGWVHGDIKPSNIIYSPQKQSIRLIDFGASQRVGTQRQCLTEWQCTPSFATQAAKQGQGSYQYSDDWFALLTMIDQFISSELSWFVKLRAKMYKKWIIYTRAI